MESKKRPKTSDQRLSTDQVHAPSAPKKRFRIEKLEERIAPKRKGGGGQLSSGAVSDLGGSIF